MNIATAPNRISEFFQLTYTKTEITYFKNRNYYIISLQIHNKTLRLYIEFITFYSKSRTSRG